MPASHEHTIVIHIVGFGGDCHDSAGNATAPRNTSSCGRDCGRCNRLDANSLAFSRSWAAGSSPVTAPLLANEDLEPVQLDSGPLNPRIGNIDSEVH